MKNGIRLLVLLVVLAGMAVLAYLTVDTWDSECNFPDLHKEYCFTETIGDAVGQIFGEDVGETAQDLTGLGIEELEELELPGILEDWFNELGEETTPIPETQVEPPPEATKKVGQPTVSSQYFPMAVGDYWNRRDAYQDLEYREEVVGIQQIEGTTVFVERIQYGSDQWYWEDYFELGSDYLAWFGRDAYDADGVLYSSERPVPRPPITLEFPFNVGQEMFHQTTYVKTFVGGGKQTERLEVHKIVEALESVNVPAGHFEGCYRIRVEITNLDNPEEWQLEFDWICPGIGQVKWMKADDSGGKDIGWTTELVEYKVQ